MYGVIFYKLIFGAFGDVLYFPLWWYSQGAVNAANFAWHFFKLGNEKLAPGLWLVNIFVPMYGQYDWEGRIISFVMRLIQVIARSIMLLFWGLLCLLLFVAWLFFPAMVIYGLIQSFNHL